MAHLKIFFVLIVGVLLFFHANADLICPTTCSAYPDCDGHCKGIKFTKGTCVIGPNLPPGVLYCCCSR
ncbi:hypothetical protein Lalb_Chr22g0355301 [Lupinus albus]|uniref:Knottin, scorpion toxin n=1 Tax=Lupinus albus TaxID=3870 RepID=A0A6A4N123_LUPAL|nr:hypothetical protein Lalb_Chr22g0355301 [Lupinus albus]